MSTSQPVREKSIHSIPFLIHPISVTRQEQHVSTMIIASIRNDLESCTQMGVWNGKYKNQLKAAPCDKQYKNSDASLLFTPSSLCTTGSFT